MKLIVMIAALFAAEHSLANEPGRSQDVVDGFAARAHTSADGTTMPYRLFIPRDSARRRPVPLIVFLHGGGGAGTDNLRQIAGGNTLGTHVWTHPDMQARYPAFVVAPQLPGLNQWSARDSDGLAPYAQLVLDLVVSLAAEFSIDPDRLYLVGQSRGGRGVWDMVSKRPRLFAAAIPVCGDGDATRVRNARLMPIWAFHGAKDDTIPVAGSRELVKTLRALGGAVRYTEYPEGGHNVWTLAFVEPELPDWLFKQRRTPLR